MCSTENFCLLNTSASRSSPPPPTTESLTALSAPRLSPLLLVRSPRWRVFCFAPLHLLFLPGPVPSYHSRGPSAKIESRTHCLAYYRRFAPSLFLPGPAPPSSGWRLLWWSDPRADGSIASAPPFFPLGPCAFSQGGGPSAWHPLLVLPGSVPPSRGGDPSSGRISVPPSPAPCLPPRGWGPSSGQIPRWWVNRLGTPFSPSPAPRLPPRGWGPSSGQIPALMS